MKSMKISLSKAMKYKKRVGSAISRVSRDIESHNSVTHDAGKKPEREVNIRELRGYRKRLVDHLITVKTLLMAANQPIYRDILLLAELKSTVSFLGQLPTEHGAVNRYLSGDTPQLQSAEIRKAEVDVQVIRLEAEIDKVQDKLDEFNATTMIEVPDYGMISEQARPSLVVEKEIKSESSDILNW